MEDGVSLVPRPTYLEAVRPLIDQPVIKVLTGMRRSGKSSLMQLLAQDLRQRGVPEGSVLHLDFENLELSSLVTPQALNHFVLDWLPSQGRGYILLDEVQEVAGWEKVVNSLQASRDVDLYITGSNSRMLSSELATYIAGRYASTQVHTLSFSEYITFTQARDEGFGAVDLAVQFDRYLRRGGFPGLTGLQTDDVQHYRAVRDIYESALLRDAIARRGLRNVDMVKRVAAFALDNVGNPFSARSVVAFFKSQRRTVAPDTVLGYLDALCEAFVLTRVPRYDLRGKTLLTINEKYYAGDHALVHAVLGYSDTRLPGVLENIVAAELQRRGYDIAIGRLGEREIDFVATKGNDRLYVQVTASLSGSESTRERELAPLLAIRDAHPKLVLSLDRQAGGNTKGVQHLWLPAWLLGQTNGESPMQ